MKQYLDALQDILANGQDTDNRTGIKTRKLFGMQMRYDLNNGFPAVTTKRLAFKAVKGELIGFIRGTSDVHVFQELGCKVWDANATADYWLPKAKFDGDLGRIYGVQWRQWLRPDGKTVDQLKKVIEDIIAVKDDPSLSVARRLIVTAWNPGELDEMALPPCHAFFQFDVNGDKLSLQMYQRSCDMFLGVPFNIASYSLLLAMVAQVTGLKPSTFVHTLGDAHIYHNHFDQVQLQLTRAPHALPKLWLNPDINNIEDFKPEDIKLLDYEFDEAISAEMAV